MNEQLRSLANFVADSAPHDWAIYLLSNVPGFPPIVQTIHILSVVAIVASTFFIMLRVVGLAVPSQLLGEMLPRLMPWTWWALPVLFITGGIFILARPHRYFLNPVFGIKVLAILVAVAITMVITKAIKNNSLPPPTLSLKFLAAVNLCVWTLIIFAGRWIAYVDYLFPR